MTCKFCGYTWMPHVPKPRKCPNPECQKYFKYSIEEKVLTPKPKKEIS